MRGPIGKLEYIALVRDIRNPVADFRPRVSVTIRLATLDDGPRLAAMMRAPDYYGPRMSVADMARLFEAGNVCFVAECRGDIAVVSWIRFDNASYNRKWISLPLRDGEAYIAGTFTRPQYHYRGLATAVSVERLKLLREREIGLAYSWIDPPNVAMRTVAARTGWVEVGKVTHYYARVIRRPLVNVLTAFDPPDPVREWFSTKRLRFPVGLLRVRRARPPVPQQAAPVRRTYT